MPYMFSVSSSPSLKNCNCNKSLMASQQKQKHNQSLYPEIIESNPESNSPFLSSPSHSQRQRSSLYPSLHDPTPNPNPNPTSSSSLYPSIEMKNLADNLFPETEEASNLPPPVEETLIRIPGAILHLIDKQNSLELASGDFSVIRIRQADNVVAVLARIGHVQWPLARDEAAVRLDQSHYFFALHDPNSGGRDSDDDEEEEEEEEEILLNYGLTFASKGQEDVLKELDRILEGCSSFSVQEVAEEVLDGTVAKEVTPAEAAQGGPKKEMLEERSAAYWTTLAPNVEDYSGSMAKVIAMGSGKLIQGILWCGDVTVERLKWGQDFLRRRMDPNSKPSEVSKDTLKRIKRVKRVTKMSEKVVTGILSGVLKVSGFFTSSVVNSKVGKKFFGLLPGEIILASLDGFAKICDAAEMAGRNVLQTSSVVTTGLVSHRYGEQAGKLTNEGLGAAGHAMGTAWAVFKIRKALNPKSAMKPTTLAKSAVKAAAVDIKAKNKKDKK